MSTTTTPSWQLPAAQGLYDPTLEKDACGVGFIVNIEGEPSHQILADAERLSCRMEHRGACSADNDSGDGAGVLIAIPHQFYADKMKSDFDVQLPGEDRYATGIVFLDKEKAEETKRKFENIAAELNLKVLLWRPVPRNNMCIGETARGSEPVMEQAFVVSNDRYISNEALVRQVFILRKTSTHRLAVDGRRYYICSLSTKTVVYKGQFNPCQLWEYFTDLRDPNFETYMCIVHTRFSTNTFPSWERAHPNRLLAHNGEINTLRGNVNLMKAREGVMKSKEYGHTLKQLYPVVEPNCSDSGSLDCVLEFLVMAGKRPLPEAIMTLVPEAWQKDVLMPSAKKDFYRFAASSMEPWDGPALLTFSDGRYVGAILDRNGLRPSRYYVTKDNLMIMASEVGVFDTDSSNIVKKGRLQPGKMLLVDVEEKRIIQDAELKKTIALSRPHTAWWKERVTMKQLRQAHQGPIEVVRKPIFKTKKDVVSNGAVDGEVSEGNIIQKLWAGDRRMPIFGYTFETIQMLVIPMFNTRKEALGSMGNDAPLACLSQMQPLVYEYFKQLFAQVTNPPIDPFRESIVMSLACPIGPEGNLLSPSEKDCHRLWLDHPIISLKDMEVIKHTKFNGWRSKVIDITYDLDDKSDPMDIEGAIDRICKEAEEAARTFQFLVLSDRNITKKKLPVSAVLVCGAVHHHLIATRLRSKCAIIMETGEVREMHQICVLIGFGCDGICPYMVFELAQLLRDEGAIKHYLTDDVLYDNYAAAADRGISKVMAKMGISTMQSYKGAQIFEAVGLAQEVIDRCFIGTPSRIGGVTFRVLAQEAIERHTIAFGERECDQKILRNPGFYHWRSGGERHVNDPTSIGLLQEATKYGNSNAYKNYAAAAMDSIRECTLRGQLEIVQSDSPVDISEVEPAAEIVKRFATGAMSFGSISIEAHTTLAMAMNRLGGKSNTGEGGENEERYLNQDPEFNKRSAIKQVASGRFGVTASYLAHADELQIKMAQGAKPGEGGELPGHKVSKEIAKTRHSVPGVGLISPPPHHDIYSIEDLAQLIYDLKSSNPKARISVKLVSEVGVGVVAAGVAKGKAEHILISGHDGGTGASSWTGIKGAGLPWELGVSETHQVLTLNNLRSRVVLQADGQMRTGFDVVVAAILGADEFGFSTAPLIVMGCTMMRKCHLNTCPVGVATQDPVLRKKFEGKPEHVVNFFFMVAEEIREIMASLGCRKFQELIGRTEFLKQRESTNPKSRLLNFDKILTNALALRPGTNIIGGSVKQDFELEKRIDAEILEKAADVLDGKAERVDIEMDIGNVQRTFGATLSYNIAMRFNEVGLPENSINIKLKGSAGQSFCAFLQRGVSVELEGDANDYVGKGLSGGEVVIYPPKDMNPEFRSEKNIIVGNVCLYGATSGTAFIRGIAAERFCVRNSGATAVTEGVGDHGCEYMTGGRVIILGSTGRNFAAGMSGGVAYIYDRDFDFESRCNLQMVELLPLELEEDCKFVKDLLIEFVKRTGSSRAKRIVDRWPVTKTKFTKVFPYEYQRALKEMQEDKKNHAHFVGDMSIDEGISRTNSVSSIILDGKELNSRHNSVSSTTSSRHNSMSAWTSQKSIDFQPGVKDIEESIRDGSMRKKKQEVLDKVQGFVKYRREHRMYRPARERTHDWDEITDYRHVRKNLRKQAARCMDCGVPFCHSASHGCPLGNIIPRFNDLVFNDKWKEALQQLLQTNNFPEFTGRVCPAPCEGACVLGINANPVTIKNIECAIIDKAFEENWIKPSPPLKRTGKRVAIIGSGPSGLAAADQLNKAGHLVTVYERNNRIGGLLQYGIPTMKLSKEVVKRRVDLMANEGIVFMPNSNVGKDISAKELKDKNDAVLMCMGATWPRDLPIPNRDATGIHFAMEFLQTWQQTQRGDEVEYISAKGLDVVVIGGGDTGNDCIGTSLRQGAKSITTFEILPQPPETRAEDNPWPQFPRLFKVDYGHSEVSVKYGGDPRRYNTLSKTFLKDSDGRVSGVETVLVEWTKDEAGRWKMAEVPDSKKTYPCQLVLLAMGFLGPEKYVIEQLEVEQNNRSNVSTSEGKYSTTVEGVFAAGDCRRGQSLVVWAITEGRMAAREVDEFLMGDTLLPGVGGIINPKMHCFNEEVKQQG